MSTNWQIKDFDPDKLFEAAPSDNIETASRFSLPVPNWLSDDATPFPHFIDSAVSEADALSGKKSGLFYSSQKNEWRFGFYNYEDGCSQAVKIDGSGVILFTGPTPNQSASLISLINQTAPDLDAMTPDQLSKILDEAYSSIQLMDRFHKSLSDLHKTMVQKPNYEGQNPNLGSFIPRPTISTYIHLSGDGQFMDGPTATPQRISGGGFVEFTNLRKDAVVKIIKAIAKDLPHQPFKAKLVSKPVFFRSRRDAQSGKPLSLADIPVQDSPLKRFYKPRPITGFPEWTPEIRAVELRWLDHIRKTFEQFGFVNIETPAVEEIEVLANKGEDVDKEIYGLKRLRAQEQEDESRLGLHYDLTVPMARYVAQRFNDLAFPFKRYQIQKVWRGDRPQKGRFREFYQCDIDVVNPGSLSLEFDAEMPIILHKLVQGLGIGNLSIGINNRKILQGFYEAQGLDNDQIIRVIRILDKLDKIGEEGVAHALSVDLGFDKDMIDLSLRLSAIKETGQNLENRINELGIKSPLLSEGVNELSFIMKRMESLPEGTAVADLSIARGFDYYTGTVYEGRLKDYPGFPVVLAGGRYDNLVEKFMSQSLPGVGISLGLTRLFAKMVEEKLIEPGAKTPTQILVTVADEAHRQEPLDLANTLRERGFCVEVFHEAGDLKKQLRYANKKQIPYVVISGQAEGLNPEVKNMKTGMQGPLKTDFSNFDI